MRILHLATCLDPGPGGEADTIRSLARSYAAAGHEVVLVEPAPRSAVRSTAWGRSVSIAAPVLPRTGGSRGLVPGRALRRVLDGEMPDRLEVSGRFASPRPGRWARTLRIPSLLVVARRPHGSRVRLVSAYDTVAWTGPGSGPAGAGRVHVPIGVDLQVFCPERADRALRAGLAQGAEVLVGWAGRLAADERPGLLLGALRTLLRSGMNVRLVLAGEGPARARLQEAARGLPVTFLGHLPDRVELAAVLASVDVVVSSGSRRPFDVSRLQALACGTPAVAVRPGLGPALAALVAAGGEQRAACRALAEPRPWARTVQTLLDLHDRPPPAEDGSPVTARARPGGQWVRALDPAGRRPGPR